MPEKRIPLTEPQARLLDEATKNVTDAKRELMALFAMACASAGVENAQLKAVEQGWMIVAVPDEIAPAESAA